MTAMWSSPAIDRFHAWRRTRKDPRQARFLTRQSVRWVLRNRAYTPWYLVRYIRLLRFRLANPHIILRGMVFLGKDVEIHARAGYGQLEIGRWVHIGDGNAVRCHEGSLRIGDKVVFGRQNVVNGYLDIEIGEAALIADWVYICDFDHVISDIHEPIKDQGIVKAPVRIGPETWVGTKVSVLRETRVGRGCVLGAHAVVRGDIEDYGIAVGSPARVVRNRVDDYEADRARREAVADMARKANEALQQSLGEPDR
ncbi:Acetyltransferase (isoleucine patch superfamily) [Haloechinothrix alba]|uniref:Acetyltransferase (Isoleucine patch superfamily) n=1 Tax=Haloechinothrix alba TaxID=664784 RepID=A0A238VNR5_9PSEU|nr:acyltransferase [Haloechinothrix alba]SNR35109.1 Acetyltransferase (isoleucine patch superfamily) [Haloechinothrix alba]